MTIWSRVWGGPVGCRFNRLKRGRYGGIVLALEYTRLLHYQTFPLQFIPPLSKTTFGLARRIVNDDTGAPQRARCQRRNCIRRPGNQRCRSTKSCSADSQLHTLSHTRLDDYRFSHTVISQSRYEVFILDLGRRSRYSLHAPSTAN